MNSILDWLQRNKEWFFSGVGVSGTLAAVALARWLLRRPGPASTPASAPALRINLAFGFLTFGPELSDQMLLFTVANPSDRPVQLTGIRLPLKNGANMVFPYLEC